MSCGKLRLVSDLRLWTSLLTVAAAAAIWAALPPAGDAQPPAAAQPTAANDAAPPAAEENAAPAEDVTEDVTQGALRIQQPDGRVVECPLTHTDVRAEISGYIARVHVTQTFRNPKDEPIEAVYVFPLPHQSAVDQMTMQVADRRIIGLIKRRAEARSIYQQALLSGQTAALLEQERPNIFTQSVGNIPPGEEVQIEISYVDVLDYDMGTYEFSFPMVVGPRFNPGTPSPPQPLNREIAAAALPGGTATTRVPDGDRINPPILRPGFRTGHDISLSVKLDAGVPIDGLSIASHEATIERDARDGDRRAQITLSDADSLPNKDFVLRYDVAGAKPSMALLAHTAPDGAPGRLRDAGYFMLMIQPQEDERMQKSPPREIVFLVDVSGSMSGAPTAKVAQTMNHMLSLCREELDTVQVVTFSGSANKLFENPVPVNRQNIQTAVNFTNAIRAGGGTQMLEGVKLAMDAPADPERVRIVIMLTDGNIGNEAEIIEHVSRNAGDRVRFWCVGIGASPNMFLIDGVARHAGGMGKLLNLNDDSQTLATEVITRIQRAQLADVEIDWAGLDIRDTYPAEIPDLWAGRPVILFGRYKGGAGMHSIRVRGNVEGEPVEWPLVVDLPESEPQHDVLAPVWARYKIESLMDSAYYGDSPAVEESVTAIALDYRLMSQYTSFVAVDEESSLELDGPAAPPYRMAVPVPLPAGTTWEGFFGPEIRPQRADLIVRNERLRELSTRGQTGNGDLYAFEATPRFINGLDAAGPLDEAAARPQTPAAASGIGGGGIGGGAFGGGEGFARRGGRRGRGGRGRGGRISGGSVGYAPLSGPSLPAGESFYFSRQQGQQKGQAGGSQSQQSLPQLEALGLRLNGSAQRFAADARLVDRLSLAQDRETGESNAAVTLRTASAWETHEEGAAYYQAAATASIEAARAALEADDSAEAKRQLQRFVFYAEALANWAAIGQNRAVLEAVAVLERLRNEQVTAWREAAPALGERLDLVLRDVPLDEAIRQVAAAAGITIELVPGSLDDAASLADDTRIHYLDLRRATVADALEWITLPARLIWTADGGRVRISSARRLDAESCWVYDVAHMATPLASELGDPENAEEVAVAAKEKIAAFMTAASEAMGADDENSSATVEWFAPGALLVIGGPEVHAQAAAFLASLTDAEADVAAGELNELRQAVQARLAERSEPRAEARAARAQMRAWLALEDHGWPLLAAAAAGKLDDRALTELQIAWTALQVQEEVPESLRYLLLRTAWMVGEAAGATPDEPRLAALAESLRTGTPDTATAAVESLAAVEADATMSQYLAALYAALARRDDAEFTASAELPYDALAAVASERLTPMSQTIVPALFGRGDAAATGRLVELIQAGSAQDADSVVLLALASRRAGGEAWQTFRAESPSLLSRLPLPGSVVVLVHELASTELPLAVR